MRTGRLILSVIVLLSVYCSTTRNIPVTENLEKRNTARIILCDETVYLVRRFRVETDSVFALEYSHRRDLRFSRADVKQIAVNNYKKTAKSGFIYGALTGAFAGVIAGNNTNIVDPLANPLTYALAWGFYGGIGGALAGAAVGNDEILLFDEP
jgi:hypothetical protein